MKIPEKILSIQRNLAGRSADYLARCRLFARNSGDRLVHFLRRGGERIWQIRSRSAAQ